MPGTATPPISCGTRTTPARGWTTGSTCSSISDELLDGVGLDYVAGSYAVLGNDGTHALDGTILTGTGAPSDVLAALYDFSDHLPVVADYAFASTTLATVPEPGTLVVLFCGVMALSLCRRHRSTALSVVR